jgi:signal peptidase II
VSEAGTTSGADAVDAAAAVATSSSGPAAASRARHWVAFFGIALGVIVLDQLVKAWVVGSFEIGVPVDVLGEWLRIWYVKNTGALFGLFRDQAILFAILSLGVMGLIIWYHGRAFVSSGWLATVALGLLLGGAVGNFIDRVRLGYVVDFVDMGIPGGWRFYTWNVADAAITTSILLLLLMVVLPTGRREPPTP